jgi:flagellar biosynthetic protein FlhB|uniref:Flagellar biosynthetic protein FlhB n=1 Tax=Desulfobacca acetoxidans TaxID=60893 RepID=A0A7C5AMH5_9BACT
MADTSYQDRTEKPTPKRRAEAREKGQIARSRDLAASLVLLTGFLLLVGSSPWGGRRLSDMMRQSLEALSSGSLTAARLHLLFMNYAFFLATLLVPIFLGLVCAAVIANFAQGGWVFSPQRLVPDLTRVAPFPGFKRLFSGNSLVELAKSLAKVALMAGVAYFSFCQQLPHLLALLRQEAGQVAVHLRTATFDLTGWLIIPLLALGGLDFFYQRHRHEKSLWMTKQEVKDEMRQTEGDPRIKARIRSLMRQMAAKRMMAAVPKADVVVTNPTHVAVALKYDRATMIAPQVVAKGQGFVALKIIALAQEAGVPRVENPALARSLYRLVEVGEVIPISLYRAVAEVLVYIYRLKARAGGEG